MGSSKSILTLLLLFIYISSLSYSISSTLPADFSKLGSQGTVKLSTKRGPIVPRPQPPLSTFPSALKACPGFLCNDDTQLCCPNGCCAYPNAICCRGGQYCCPGNYPVCDINAGLCHKFGETFGVAAMKQQSAKPKMPWETIG